MAPAPIESRLKEHALVEQVMVVGDGQKFVSALIVPTEEALVRWAAAQGLGTTALADLARDPQVVAEYQGAVDALNPSLSHTEQIKKFVVVPGPWDVTHADGRSGELTPTLKLKRRVIAERYAREIEEIYK